MMYEDIRSACSEYHSGSRAYDEEYNSYMLDKDWPKWNQGTLDLAEAGKLIAFLNLWDTPMPVRLIDLLPQLQFVAKVTQLLCRRTILDVKFDDVAVEQLTVSQLIQSCFNKLANCKRAYNSTAASKILHTINPGLFVMWDRKIRKKYGRMKDNPFSMSRWERGDREVYVYFLAQVQADAKKAIEQIMAKEGRVRADAIRSLKSDSHDRSIKLLPHHESLAKVLDEFNYVTSR